MNNQIIKHVHILENFIICEILTSQKVHLLGIRNTMKEHASKGIKNIFDTLQKANIPFDVFLL